MHRAGKFFAAAFTPRDYRNRGILDGEARIDVQHAQRFLFRLLFRGVGGVPFLPVEFQRTQEEARAHLPTHHVTPLVDEQRQVPVTLDPFGVHVPDDGFRGRAYYQRLF